MTIFGVITQHRRDNAGSTIRRRSDDTATGGILFADCHRIQVDPVQCIVRQYIDWVLRCVPQQCGTAPEVQATGQFAPDKSG